MNQIKRSSILNSSTDQLFKTFIQVIVWNSLIQSNCIFLSRIEFRFEWPRPTLTKFVKNSKCCPYTFRLVLVVLLIWMLEWKRRTLQTKSLKYFLFCQLNYRTFLSRASPKELIDYSEFLHTDRFQERSCPKLIHRLRSIEKKHKWTFKEFEVF